MYRSNEEAKRRLVRSPERVQSKIASLAESGDRLREETSVLEGKIRALQAKMEVLGKLGEVFIL